MTSPWSALHALRLGCVQYLNSRPLIHAYDGAVQYDHPSALARGLASGALDAALVPVFEILRDPRYDIVDEVAIACDGPVHSVVLAYHGPLRQVRSIALDPASMSSVHLLKILLTEFHQVTPEYRKDGDAQLIIGNQAIAFRAAADKSDSSWHWLDLGEEWVRQTGLPFVFAVWALRPGLERAPEIAAAFRALKREGLRRTPEIVAVETFQNPEFRARYLTEHIRFELGVREKAGLSRYRALLHGHGYIPDAASPLRFL